MASAAQVLANKANAQHSTGPKTETGKATSSQNATKHGFTSQTLVILPGQEDTFTELESTLRQQFAPEPGYQEFLFHRILHAAWNQHRCECAEVELHAESATPGRYRHDVHLAATAGQTIKGHLAKLEQTKPIAGDRDGESESFSFGRLFRR